MDIGSIVCVLQSDGKLSNSDSQSLSDVISTSSCRHQLQYRLAFRNQSRTCSTGSGFNVPPNFKALRCQSQSQTYSDRSSLHSTFHEVHSNDDINVRRALGSFSSVTSEPAKEIAESGVITTQVSRENDVINSDTCRRHSMTSLDVVDCTPFDVGMWHINDEKLMAAPESLHADRHGPGTRVSHQGHTPVINVFQRSTAAPFISISDNEVFVNTTDY